jgi:hypothetical protein
MKKITRSLLPPAASAALLLLASGSAAPLAPPASPGDAPGAFVGPSASHALEEFCAQHWGTLSGDAGVCRFEQSFHLNLTHAGEAPVLTGIAIAPTDTVRVEAANVPEAVIGARSYEASRRFVAPAGGYLSFRPAPGQGIFSVQRVTIDRCFTASESGIGPVACPAPGAAPRLQALRMNGLKSVL